MSPTCNPLLLNIMPNPRQQKISFEACLVGQVFFISSTAYKADHIAKNIVLLGGRTELFFSKNVTSLLVDDYYVNEFKTQYQKLSQNVVSMPEAKASGIAKHSCPVPKTQEIINLTHPAHFQSNAAVSSNFTTNADLAKVRNLSQNQVKNNVFAKYGMMSCFTTDIESHCQIKNEGIIKFGLLSNCPPSIEQLNKYSSLPFQSETNELKKLAMFTACTVKESEHSGFSPAACYQSTKFIPLNAVQTFNNGLGQGAVSTSRGYSVFLSSKAKQDKLLQEHSVFRLMQRAQQWGISIIGICQFMRSVDMYLSGDFNKPKRRPRTTNKTNLSGCYLKVEDIARKYKAFYKILKEDPVKYLPLHNKFISQQVELYGNAIKFIADILNVIEGLMRGTITASIPVVDSKSKTRKVSPKPEQPAKIVPKGRKKQNHFCECCNIYFSDFTHVYSERHKAFASNEKNYECIKDVMRTLPTLQDFLYKHTLSSETKPISLPISVCDKPYPSQSTLTDATDAVIRSALDYTIKAITPIAKIENGNKPIIAAEEPTAIDFTLEKCVLFDELAALGTLTPTIDDSQIKFEFDDECWNDPLYAKDVPTTFNDDRFKEFSEHCQKLLVDAKILPAHEDVYQQAIPGPSMNTPSLFRDSQGSWKNDSNSTALNLSRIQPSLKDDTTNCTQSVVTPEFSSTSQTIDQFHLSPKFPTVDTKVSNSGASLPKDSNEPKNFQPSVEDSLPSKICNLTKSPVGQSLKAVTEVNNETPNVLPKTDKILFSSDSSESDCGKEALIGDVLTRINCSEGDYVQAKPCIKAMSPKPLEKHVENKIHIKRISPSKHQCKRKLPSRWSVSIVPSKTIRMRFTCLPNPPINANEPGSSGNSSIYPCAEDSEVL